MATRMNGYPFEARGSMGAIMSMPHIENDQGDAITFKGVGGTCTLSA